MADVIKCERDPRFNTVGPVNATDSVVITHNLESPLYNAYVSRFVKFSQLTSPVTQSLPKGIKKLNYMTVYDPKRYIVTLVMHFPFLESNNWKLGKHCDNCWRIVHK